MTQEAVCLAPNDPDAAIALFEEAVVLAGAHDLALVAFYARRSLGELYVRTGRSVAAAELLTDGLATMRRRSAWIFAQQSIVAVAELLAREGDDETAAVLYGSVRSSAAAGSPLYKARLEILREELRERLGADRFDQLADAGELLPIDQAARLGEDKLNKLVQRDLAPNARES
jgi:hypothetical protein